MELQCINPTEMKIIWSNRDKNKAQIGKATFKLDWWRLKQKKEPYERFNIEKLKEPATIQLYASELNDKL